MNRVITASLGTLLIVAFVPFAFTLLLARGIVELLDLIYKLFQSAFDMLGDYYDS